MSCWALLALKPPPLGKTRLSGLLPGAEREHLVLEMFDRVINALQSAREIDHIAVVTPEPGLLPRGVVAVADPGAGLNHALDAGRREITARGARELLVLHADLPTLTSREVDVFVRQGRRTGLALAPDHHRQGTNGLVLSLPSAFGFRFGTASLALHLGEARRCGLDATLSVLPGFAHDIDEPADLQHLPRSSSGCRRAPLPAPRSTPRWTASPKIFLPLHSTERG
ncbi:MAG: 2-phospho-L-lactate guanylyltransferase [Proteobacteria bacterium]|nr:2-phospho-L-lactate guanylyltransferase [Pseudomonadota bacterium]MBS0551634.1 2-phospho-L-lactate guanylyltransferase [Pseudomonadota bacterium]